MDRFEFGMGIGIQERKGLWLIFPVGVSSDMSILEMVLMYQMYLRMLKNLKTQWEYYLVPSLPSKNEILLKVIKEWSTPFTKLLSALSIWLM